LNIGDIWKPGDLAFSFQGTDPHSIMGYWVKIEADATSGKDEAGSPKKVRWYGIITDVAVDHHGTVLDGVDLVSTQDFIVHCYGPEWILTRKQVTTSVVDDGSGGDLVIGRGLAFNGYRVDTLGRQVVAGNKDANRRVFGTTKLDAEVWNAQEIIQYLLDYHEPTDPNPDWFLDTTVSGDVMFWHKPVIETHGRTLYDIINSVVPRERGITWKLEVDESASTIYIVPFSGLQTPIVLPGGNVIPANPSTIQLDLMRQRHISRVARLVSKQPQYHQVRVTGDRSGRIFTARVGFELVKDWTPTLETEYADAAHGAAGYAALEQAEKARLNDSARMSDKLSRVYTTFRLVDNWDGQANGQDVKQGAEFWQPGLRFEAYLPLLKGYDYSTSASAPTNNNPTATNPEFMRPIVIGSIAPLPFWEHLDRLASSAFSEYFGFGIQWACHFRPQENQPGIIIDPTAPPHVLAKNQFTANEPTEHESIIDYTTIEATVYCKWDNYCEGIWPPEPAAAEHDQVQVLEINIGDRAKLDYLVPNTVLGLSNAEKILATGGYVRDDREYCRDLARAAFAYYGQMRHAISYGLDIINTHVEVGDLVTSFQDGPLTRPVNCLVSSIHWDFGRQATSVQTDFLEIDFGALV
jgi:hypothetical protein